MKINNYIYIISLRFDLLAVDFYPEACRHKAEEASASQTCVPLSKDLLWAASFPLQPLEEAWRRKNELHMAYNTEPVLLLAPLA
jgi:hypothetical protein